MADEIIPAKARKVFNIEPGDNLIVPGDEAQGIAIIAEKNFMHLMEQIKNKYSIKLKAVMQRGAAGLLFKFL